MKTIRFLIAGVTATAVTTTTAFLARTGFIDGEFTAFPFFAIQSLDGRRGAFLGVHGRKSEPSGAAGDFVHDDIDLVHRAMRGKHVAQVVFGDVKGKVPNV